MGSPQLPPGFRWTDELEPAKAPGMSMSVTPAPTMSTGLGPPITVENAPKLPEGYKYNPPPIPQTPASPDMSWGDFGRALMTAGVRGTGGVVDALADPLAPVRRLISPEMERFEQQSSGGGLGTRLGNAVFNATGVPEYQTDSAMGRLGQNVAQGAAGGRLFGPAGMVVGALGGGAAGLAREYFSPEAGKPETGWSPSNVDRAETIAGLLPGGAMTGVARRASRNIPEGAPYNPTLGQALGGGYNRFEQGMTDIWGIGDMIRGGRRGAIEEYNRGYIDRALGHIGEQLDPNTPLGRPAIEAADRLIGNRYDAIAPRIGPLSFDQNFVADLGNINQNLAMRGRNTGQLLQGQLADILRAQIIDRMNQPGGLHGQVFRDAESQLGQIARDNLGGTVNERILGRAVFQLQTALRDQLRRNNPQVATELTGIHRAYSEMQPMDIAAGRRGTGLQGQAAPGVVSPSQLVAGVEAHDPTPGNTLFRQGRAVGQDYAEPGVRVLGDNLPNSGSPYRLLSTAGTAALAGSPWIDPLYLALGAGGTALAAGMYSPQGRAAMNYFLRRPGQSAAATYFDQPDDLRRSR